MAGFDCSVPFNDKNVLTIRKALLYCSRKAPSFDLQLHFARNNKLSHYEIVVDGGLIDMQLFGIHLSSTLYAYMEGVRLPQYKKVTASILLAYVDGFYEVDKFIKEVVSKTRVISPTISPNTLVFDRLNPSTSKRLDSFSQAALSFVQGDISPETYLEEFHSLVEFLAQILLKKESKSLSYEEMVMRLVQREYINSKVAPDIIRYKNLRRDIKHRRGSVPKKEIKDLLGRTTSIVHLLTSSTKHS